MIELCEPWDVTWTCDINCDSPAVTGQAVTVASNVLWALSGRRFGLCPVTIRPCRRTCNDLWQAGWGSYMYPLPALIGGLWYNLTCGSCSGDTCSCTELSEVVLPGWVQAITEVKIDDVVLPSTAYRVDNYKYLVRTDGGRWPFCNDLSRNGGPGTWSVTATYGLPVPDAGKLAVGELACEFAKLLNNDSACRLPKSVKQVNRQGVTIDYQDSIEMLKTGLVGLYFVDLFLSTYNPHRLTAPPAVFNVDGPHPRVTTWVGP